MRRRPEDQGASHVNRVFVGFVNATFVVKAVEYEPTCVGRTKATKSPGQWNTSSASCSAGFIARKSITNPVCDSGTRDRACRSRIQAFTRADDLINFATMTAVPFDQFLIQNKSRVVEIDGPAAIFDSDAPVDEPHIDAAETRLGVPLPASYRTFLRVCGSGRWCGDYVAPPEDLYAFDEDCGAMEGFVALVHNVGGVGNFVAMNPHEQTAPGEWALYYCSHDPFGFGRIAASFEAWAREAVTALEENQDLYEKAADDVARTWRSFRANTRKWWQFWR